MAINNVAASFLTQEYPSTQTTPPQDGNDYTLGGTEWRFLVATQNNTGNALLFGGNDYWLEDDSAALPNGIIPGAQILVKPSYNSSWQVDYQFEQNDSGISTLQLIQFPTFTWSNGTIGTSILCCSTWNNLGYSSVYTRQPQGNPVGSWRQCVSENGGFLHYSNGNYDPQIRSFGQHTDAFTGTDMIFAGHSNGIFAGQFIDQNNTVTTPIMGNILWNTVANGGTEVNTSNWTLPVGSTDLRIMSFCDIPSNTVYAQITGITSPGSNVILTVNNGGVTNPKSIFPTGIMALGVQGVTGVTGPINGTWLVSVNTTAIELLGSNNITSIAGWAGGNVSQMFLYATIGDGIYMRNDGANPSWGNSTVNNASGNTSNNSDQNNYAWFNLANTHKSQSGLRGLTINQPGTEIFVAHEGVDGFVFHFKGAPSNTQWTLSDSICISNATAVSNLGNYYGDANVMSYSITAYNNMTWVTNGSAYMLLMGYETEYVNATATSQHLCQLTTNATSNTYLAGHAGLLGWYNDNWYALNIVANSAWSSNTVSLRTIATSPFTTDINNGGRIFFGGFDCNFANAGLQNTHNTGWLNSANQATIFSWMAGNTTLKVPV